MCAMVFISSITKIEETARTEDILTPHTIAGCNHMNLPVSSAPCIGGPEQLGGETFNHRASNFRTHQLKIQLLYQRLRREDECDLKRISHLLTSNGKCNPDASA